MRKLTMTRKKRFLACAMKVYVYIETESNKDIILDGVPCRKMGYLKNGQMISFDIPSKRCSVFVCYSTIAPDKYKAGYVIHPSDSDVVLYTKATFDPLKGNPFVISNL